MRAIIFAQRIGDSAANRGMLKKKKKKKKLRDERVARVNARKDNTLSISVLTNI